MSESPCRVWNDARAWRERIDLNRCMDPKMLNLEAQQQRWTSAAANDHRHKIWNCPLLLTF